MQGKQSSTPAAEVFLRALEMDDLDRLHRWHNDPALYESLVGTFRSVSRSAEEEWLRKRVAYSTQEENFAICTRADARHIGNAYLRDIDWVSRNANVSIFIGDTEQRHRGHGTGATLLLMRHAFRDLGLFRLCCLLLEENTASRRMFEKCGWAVEGRLRGHTFKDGAYRDTLLLAALSDGARTA